jgi:hypothetical protein
VPPRPLGINIAPGIAHIAAQLQPVLGRKTLPTPVLMDILADILRRRFMAARAAIVLLPALGQATTALPAVPSLRRCKRRRKAKPETRYRQTENTPR